MYKKKVPLSEEKAFQDLIWALEAEPLLNIFPGFDNGIFYKIDSKTIDLFKKGEIETKKELKDFIRIENEISGTFLGKYFERLLDFYFKHAKGVDLIASGLQIFNHKTTIGELDFLISENGQKIHLECAIKYYLLFPTKMGPLWVGPNGNDRLDLKMGKMKKKQLQLLTNENTIKSLKNKNLNAEDFQSKSLIRGQLFVPLENQDQEFPIINPHCIVGNWIYSSFLSDYIMNSERRWYLLPKKYWLGPCEEQEIQTPLLSPPLLKSLDLKINDEERAEMLIGFGEIDSRKLMVVCENWPKKMGTN